MKKEIINVAVCEGRHEIKEAIDGAIFGSVIKDVTNVTGLEIEAEKRLEELFEVKSTLDDLNYKEKGDIMRNHGHLNLYVTGLTVATLAILNVCRIAEIPVICWHYDRESGKYFPQRMEM